MDYLTQSAETGNQYAQYTLGKVYLEEHDEEQARYWFTVATSPLRRGSSWVSVWVRQKPQKLTRSKSHQNKKNLPKTNWFLGDFGAAGQIRTADLILTNSQIRVFLIVFRCL